MSLNDHVPTLDELKSGILAFATDPNKGLKETADGLEALHQVVLAEILHLGDDGEPTTSPA